MKIAIIGCGTMGKLIERLALEKAHKIGVVVDENQPLSESMLNGVDVAMDFSTAAAVKHNIEACIAAGVPLVEGTTGWNSQKDEIERIVMDGKGSMVFGANFSVGVNLFYRIADHAAELFSKFPEYEAFIEEQHHSRKLDAPSGTALKLRDIVSDAGSADGGVRGPRADEGVRVPIASSRAGNIPGTHRVGFDGPADQIMLEHTARTREGFALGAIMAAEWIIGKKGFYEFGDVMDEMIGRE